jgi:hypothetical protein
MYVCLIGGAGVVLIATAIATGRQEIAGGAIGPLLFGMMPQRQVITGAKGKDLIPVLGGTAQVQLATGLLLTLGLAIS